MTTDKTDKIIEQEIENLLTRYLANPTLMLREANPQAELYYQLRSQLGRTQAQISNGTYTTQQTFEIYRIQLEIQTSIGKHDIVVFEEREKIKPVVLTGGDNGVLDILQSGICPNDLEAVIEVKAAPSKNSDKEMANDVLKLLNLLRASNSIHAHFVNIDKSVTPPNYVSRHPKKCKGKNWWTHSLLSNVTLTVTAPTNVPYVHIWDLWDTHYQNDTIISGTKFSSKPSNGIVHYYAHF